MTTDYGYEADGNQTSAGGASYTYNAADELTGADTAAGNFTYTYNSDSELADTGLNGTKISGTIWDLNNPLPEVAETTGGVTLAGGETIAGGAAVGGLIGGGAYAVGSGGSSGSSDNSEEERDETIPRRIQTEAH